MARKILVLNPSAEHAISHCEALEAGDILFFQDIPFSFPQEEIDFLLKHAGRYLSKDPKRSDILSVYAGLRPLIKKATGRTLYLLSWCA